MTWMSLLLAAAASLTEGLVIETGSPDALCPELAATQAAVRSRLGVVGVTGRAGWKARYTLWHSPGQDDRDFVRLELIGPDGTRQLNRDLPLQGSSCPTMASAIAIVLERYFSDVGSDVSGAKPVVAESPSRPSPPPSPPPAAPSSLVLSVAAGALGEPLCPAMSIGLAYERRRLRVLIQAALPLTSPDESASATESVTLQTTVPLRLTAQVRAANALGGLHIGPELVLAHDRARAQLPVSGSNSRVAWGAGVQGGTYLAFGGGRWRLTVDVAFDRVIGGGRFTIDGHETLPMTWRGMAIFGLAGAFGR